MAVEAAVLWRVLAYQISEWPRHWKDRRAFLFALSWIFFFSLCLSSLSYFFLFFPSGLTTIQTSPVFHGICFTITLFCPHNLLSYPHFSILSPDRKANSLHFSLDLNDLITKSNHVISGSPLCDSTFLQYIQSNATLTFLCMLLLTLKKVALPLCT